MGGRGSAYAACCRLKEPQKPPLMSHCSAGAGPVATALCSAALGGVQTPGETQASEPRPWAVGQVRGELRCWSPWSARAGRRDATAQSSGSDSSGAARGILTSAGSASLSPPAHSTFLRFFNSSIFDDFPS